MGTNAFVYKEGKTSEFLRKQIRSDDEAYEMYNDYAFRNGFGIRIDKSEWRRDGSFLKKQFVCANEGFKDDKRKNLRSYEKFDARTGCLAFVHFHVDEQDVWTCTRHAMVHKS